MKSQDKSSQIKSNTWIWTITHPFVPSPRQRSHGIYTFVTFKVTARHKFFLSCLCILPAFACRIKMLLCFRKLNPVSQLLSWNFPITILVNLVNKFSVQRRKNFSLTCAYRDECKLVNKNYRRKYYDIIFAILQLAYVPFAFKYKMKYNQAPIFLRLGRSMIPQ